MELIITAIVAVWAIGYLLALCLDDIWARAGWKPHAITLLPGGWADGPGPVATASPANRPASRSVTPAPQA